MKKSDMRSYETDGGAIESGFMKKILIVLHSLQIFFIIDKQD